MHNAQFFDFRYSFQIFLVTLQGKRDDKLIILIDYILVDARAVHPYFKFLLVQDNFSGKILKL